MTDSSIRFTILRGTAIFPIMPQLCFWQDFLDSQNDSSETVFTK